MACLIHDGIFKNFVWSRMNEISMSFSLDIGYFDVSIKVIIKEKEIYSKAFWLSLRYAMDMKIIVIFHVNKTKPNVNRITSEKCPEQNLSYVKVKTHSTLYHPGLTRARFHRFLQFEFNRVLVYNLTIFKITVITFSAPAPPPIIK